MLLLAVLIHNIRTFRRIHNHLLFQALDAVAHDACYMISSASYAHRSLSKIDYADGALVNGYMNEPCMYTVAQNENERVTLYLLFSSLFTNFTREKLC
jgi:hypothetical protein